MGHYYDEKLKCDSIEKKISEDGKVRPADPLDGLYGPEGTLEDLTKLLESGEKSYRRSSPEYEKIKKSIEVLNKQLVELNKNDKTKTAGYLNIESYKYAQLRLREIMEKTAKYIKKREKDRIDEATNSYKGWRLTLMREIHGRIAARTEAITEFNGRLFSKSPIDISQYYKRHLKGVCSEKPHSKYQLAEQLMAGIIDEKEKNHEGYDYHNFEKDCNKLYNTMTQGRLVKPNDIEDAKGLINTDGPKDFNFATGILTDIKHKIHKDDYKKMEDPDVNKKNVTLKQQRENVRKQAENDEYETTFI